MGWFDEYPHTLYASVLLNPSNKIENWKVGNRKWNHVFDMTWMFPLPDNIDLYKVETTSWEVNNSEEHEKVFTTLAKEWFKQWEYEENKMGFDPY